MARKQSGFFSKALNFIGLVDDGEPREIYQDEYNSDNYGQQQPYAPQRNQRAQANSRPRQDSASRRSYEPTRAPQMNRNGASSRFDQPRDSRTAAGSNRRPSGNASRPENRSAGYDYSPRTSRFGEVPSEGSRFDDSAARNNRPQANRPRTVMFSLRDMKDCCDVIDSLVENNTVVLTLDELDSKLCQRAVDTLSGAVFALRATISKASEFTYLIAPNGVEVDSTYEVERRF